MRRSARSMRRSVGERSIDPMRGARNVEGQRGTSSSVQWLGGDVEQSVRGSRVRSMCEAR